MSDLHPELKEYYDYWDDFITNQFQRITCPDACIVNNAEEVYASRAYLPEPWWGWNGQKESPLKSVVINLNPGTAGCVQCSHVIRKRFGENFSYREMIETLRQHHPAGEKWHLKRAKAIQNLIESQEQPSDTKSHLSIEMYPFHSVTANDKEFLNFFNANASSTKKNVFEFAAKAASLIKGELENVVFVRITPQRFEKFLKSLKIEPKVKHSNPSFSLFIIDGFDDTRFITATGVRNNFPCDDQSRVKYEGLIKLLNQ